MSRLGASSRWHDAAQDIIPIGEFKTHASQLLRQLHATRRPLVITQNSRAAAVVVTPEDFKAMGYRELVKAKVWSGIASAAKDGIASPALPSRCEAPPQIPRCCPGRWAW